MFGNCAICFEDRHLIKGHYKCDTDHFFCEKCLKEWGSKSDTCPMCRKPTIVNRTTKRRVGYMNTPQPETPIIVSSNYRYRFRRWRNRIQRVQPDTVNIINIYNDDEQHLFTSTLIIHSQIEIIDEEANCMFGRLISYLSNLLTCN